MTEHTKNIIQDTSAETPETLDSLEKTVQKIFSGDSESIPKLFSKAQEL